MKHANPASRSPFPAFVLAGILGAGLLVPIRVHAGPFDLHEEILPVKTATANSLRCHVTLTLMQDDGNFAPLQNQTLEMVRKSGAPLELRIDAQTFDPKLKAPQTPKEAVFAVRDGKSVEFDAGLNQFQHAEVKAGGGVSSHWVRGASEDLDFLNGKVNASEKPTHDVETVDGRQMDVFTFVVVRTKDQKPGFVGKYYVDSVTGYPYRKSYFVEDKKFYFNASLVGLKTTGPVEYMRRQFSGWEINPAIAAEAFAYTPPVAAKELVQKPMVAHKEYVTPVLLTAGAAAPDFECVGTDGKPVHLSDFRGKTVILDFWAVWCGPCQAAMPHLERVYNGLRGKDVAVLAVCVNDSQTRYDGWRVTHKSDYTFPVAFAPTDKDNVSPALALYGVSGIPSSFVIDKDGKVAAALVGYEGEADHRLDDILGKMGIALPAPPVTTAAATVPGAPKAGGS